MMVIAFFTSLMGLKNGVSWAEIEKSIVRSSTKTTGPILIFLSIGALIGSFMLSGAVPSLLYYGLNILSPTYFYPLTCLICALVAVCIGSPWTTAATVGVALNRRKGLTRNSFMKLATPPAQIRTCATNAYGSYDRSNTEPLIRVWVYYSGVWYKKSDQFG
jgi:hypothetical protein